MQKIAMVSEIRLLEAKSRIAKLERENRYLKERIGLLRQGRKSSLRWLEDRYGLVR